MQERSKKKPIDTKIEKQRPLTMRSYSTNNRLKLQSNSILFDLKMKKANTHQENIKAIVRFRPLNSAEVVYL